MAISRTGYGGMLDLSTGSTGSTDITVAVNTDCLVVYVCGYRGTANPFTTLTCERASADSYISSADASTNAFQGAGWAFLSPPSGSGVTLAWTWAGALNNNAALIWVAYSGVASLRGNYGDHEASSGGAYETTPLTSSSGDVISVAVFGYVGIEGDISSWTNATEISEFDSPSYCGDFTLAEHSSTGNVAITATIGTGYEDGGIMAFVLTPTSGAASAVPANRGNLGMMMGMSVGMWLDNDFLKPTGGN